MDEMFQNIGTENQNNSSNKIESLKVKFNQIRVNWGKNIGAHLENFTNIQDLTELQPAVFRDRQILIEQKHKLQETCERLSRVVKEQSRGLYLKYSTDGAIKSKSYQAMSLLIDGDVAEITERYNVISNHIIFLEETLRTIDHIIYGINYRVKLEEYK